jgi:hypothetical protein
MFVTGPIFTKHKFAAQIFVKNTYIKFHENPTSGLVADGRSQKKGRTE